MKAEYPKFIYHKSFEAKIVQSAEEHKLAGLGWSEMPAGFEESSKAVSDATLEEKPKRKPKKELL